MSHDYDDYDDYDDDYDDDYGVTEAEQKRNDALSSAADKFYADTWPYRQKMIVAGNPELAEMARQYDAAFAAVSDLEKDRLDVIASLPMYADLLPTLREARNEHQTLVLIDKETNSYNVVMGAFAAAYEVKLSMQKMIEDRYGNTTKPLRDEYEVALAPHEAVYKAKVAAINAAWDMFQEEGEVK